MSQYARYPTLTVGGSGVSSLNGQTGALTLIAGSNITITPGAGTLTIASTGGGGGSGTVTSVGLTVPSFLSVAGSPVTTSGTFAVSLANQSANTIFAGPTTGSPAAPTFRAIVAADIPTLNQNTTGTADNVTGVVAIANGGSGQTTANDALNAFLPSQTGNNGKVLGTDGTNTSWVSGASPTGTPNTFAGFDGTGALESIPGWGISTNTGGVLENLTQASADTGGGTTYTINSFVNTIAPTANLVNLNYQGLQNYTYLNAPFDQNAYIGINNGIETNDVGNKGYLTSLNQTLYLGDGTNVSSDTSAHMINQQLAVRASHTSEGIVGISQTMQVDVGGAVNNQMTGADLSFTLNEAITTTGYTAINLNNQYYKQIQYATGINQGHTFRTGSSSVNGVTGHNDGLQVETGATVNGYSNYGAFANIAAGATVNGYTAYNSGITFNGNIPSSNGYTGANINAGFYGTSGYVNGVSVNNSLESGAVITNGITGFIDNAQLKAGSTVNYYSGIQLGMTLDAGATVTTANVVNASPQINGTIPQLTLYNSYANGSGTVDNLTGLQINVNRFSGGVATTNPSQGISVQANTNNISAEYRTGTFSASPGFLNLNAVGGNLQVDAGSPMTSTLVLANNMGVGGIFFDDMGPDGFGAIAGFTPNGLVSQLAVDTGKTVHTVTPLLVAASVPGGGPGIPTGGTVTNFNAITVGGAFPGGGTLSITTLKGLNIPSFFNSFSATNAWGVYVGDTTVNNWFAKNVVVGGATGVPSGAYALDVTGDVVFTGQIVSATSSTGSIDQNNRYLLDSSANTAVLWNTRELVLATGSSVLDWSAQTLKTISTGISVDWGVRQLVFGGDPVVDWSTQNLLASGSNPSVDWQNRNLVDSLGYFAVGWDTHTLKAADNTPSMNWDNRQATDSLGNIVLDWGGQVLKDAAGFEDVNWFNRQLLDTAGVESLSWAQTTALRVTDHHVQVRWAGPVTLKTLTAAGSGSTATVIAANDVAGTIQVDTGTGCVGVADFVEIDFVTPYSVAPVVVITPGNLETAIMQGGGSFVISATNSFIISVKVAPNDSTTYIWNYHVIEVV